MEYIPLYILMGLGIAYLIWAFYDLNKNGGGF